MGCSFERLLAASDAPAPAAATPAAVVGGLSLFCAIPSSRGRLLSKGGGGDVKRTLQCPLFTYLLGGRTFHPSSPAGALTMPDALYRTASRPTL